MDYSKQYLDQIVSVRIDRPLGTKHPKWEFYYPVNYGYIPNTKAPDGEEIDAYVLGILSLLKNLLGNALLLSTAQMTMMTNWL